MLTRWRARAKGGRQVVCIGDSITQATAFIRNGSAVHGWVLQLATALEVATGPRRSDGFRGIWRGQEWSMTGSWRRPTTDDRFDLAPFGCGFYSSGTADDRLRWTKPADVVARSFDLYWFTMPEAGAFQLRTDDAAWQTVSPSASEPDRLQVVHIDQPVERAVEIRGHDGRAPCIAPIAGLVPYTAGPPARLGSTVHNLGLGRGTIDVFCKTRSGDRMALLDELRPDLVTLLFSNDVIHDDPEAFERRVNSVVERVQPYADVLLINPFEQRRSLRVVYEGDLRIGTRDPAMQSSYRAATRRVAEARGCALVDLYDAWATLAGPGWESADAMGLMLDEFHPSQAGHDDIFGRVRRQLGC
jgi:lysophospholipase L1-like esterase